MWAESSVGGAQAWTSRECVTGLAMVVTQLDLELRFQGSKLRGFRCELTRCPRGGLPETTFTIVGQVVVPVVLSGLGMVTAGLLMNTVQVRTVRRGAAWALGWGTRHHTQDRPLGRAGGRARRAGRRVLLGPQCLRVTEASDDPPPSACMRLLSLGARTTLLPANAEPLGRAWGASSPVRRSLPTRGAQASCLSLSTCKPGSVVRLVCWPERGCRAPLLQPQNLRRGGLSGRTGS